MWAIRHHLAFVVLAGAVLVGCTDDGMERGSGSSEASAAPRLAMLHATRGTNAAILDDAGRQVRLRGVNVNSLGDYYQADPRLPTVVPVTDADWADMAKQGFNVVRLLVSWSSLEPTRDAFDDAYVGRVHDAVRAASAHGIYSVIDMHQDAWSKFIASPPGVVCAPGSEPAIGWDGAPQWATFTDGADTCQRGSRESSEAVMTAWDSFYANRDGIMDELVEAWAQLATSFRDDPAVAGYDLLNEPNHGHDGERAKTALGTFYAKAINAIRSAETTTGSIHHIAFFETTVFGVPVAPGFTTDDNIVFAPHNYAESIDDLPIDGIFDYFAGLAAQYGTAMWVGEYGWFSDPPASAEKLARFAAKEDSLRTAGDTWWQWRQACGDPHSIGEPGGTPDAILIHFRRNGCPGDHDLGIVPEWKCVSRPYARAAPGYVTLAAADCTNHLTLTAHTDQAGRLEVWFPDANTGKPEVHGDHITNIQIAAVPGGWNVTAQANGDYSLVASGNTGTTSS
jgi:endoglycosylceramidase